MAQTSPNKIVVQYNEAMFAADQTKSNYELFGPGGAAVTITNVTPDVTLPNAYDITYAGGQIGGAYTLFVKGDQVHESTDMVTLTGPGQLAVANSGAGQSTLSTINATDGSTVLNAVQTYPMGLGLNPLTPPTPTSVVVADFNGDGVADLAVARNNAAGNPEVDIYAGIAGGGFNATPDATLAPVPGDTAVGALIAFSPTGAVTATGFADLAVADPTNGNIDVFVNQGKTGVPVFDNAVSDVSGATDPVGLAVGDFNNDGNTDLAVADGVATGGNFNVDFLPGNGDGTFGASTAVVVGTTGPTGLQTPTSIAAGPLANANSADLAVGGSNGVVTLINSGTAGAFTFTEGVPVNSTSGAGLLNNVTSVAIGNINGDGLDDIVASSSTSTNVEVLANADDGSGTINAALSKTFSLGAGHLGNVVALSTDASGLSDIIVANTAANQVTVLQNTSTPLTFSFAAAAHYAVDTSPIALAIGAVYGDATPDVITANLGAGGNQGGSFSILRNNGSGIYLVSAPLQETANAATRRHRRRRPERRRHPRPGRRQLQRQHGVGLPGHRARRLPAPVMYSVSDINGKGNGPVSVTLAHLSGPNGPLDLITANRDGTVSVLINNGSGAFAQAVTYVVGNDPTQVVAGVFDSSGNISLAVAHDGPGASRNARGVTLLLGNGDGTFQVGQEILSGVAATALVAGNFTSTAGAPLDLAVADDANATVVLLKNADVKSDGLEGFTNLGSFAVGAHPSALIAADVNRDGLLDVIAVSKDTGNGKEQISVLLNSASSGFAPAVNTALPFNFAVNSVAVTDVNGDAFPDVVVGLSGSPTQPTSENAPADSNVYVLTGNGDGTFGDPIPYMAGGPASATVVATVSDPMVRVTTFNLISNIVKVNLIANGGFEGKDLSGQQGNLIGWQTAQVPDSRGGFYTQTGTLSPLSLTRVPAPTGPAGAQSLFRAMDDQSNLIPLSPGPFGFNQNSTESYAGSNFLYQLVTLPTQATQLNFSIDLYLQSLSGWTSGEASLFYNNPDNTNPDEGNDQQVRVDIMNPNAPGFAITDSSGADILDTVFQTTSTDPDTMNLQGKTAVTANLSSLLAAYAGKQVLIRIAAVNNMGPMLVGVDNVSLTTMYTDTTRPTFPGQPELRNPGYLVGPNLDSTTDPTLVGQVADDGGVNNIAYVAFSPTGDTTFNQPGDFRISALSLDATGHFSVTLPNPVMGLNTVNVEVVDKAGNVTMGTPIDFIYQGPSVTDWQAVGPGGIDTANSGVQFNSVSGRVNSVLVDPQDPSGDTYLVGSENGGVWKTTDGGADWTPATDYISEGNNPISTPIGARRGRR